MSGVLWLGQEKAVADVGALQTVTLWLVNVGGEERDFVGLCSVTTEKAPGKDSSLSFAPATNTILL